MALDRGDEDILARALTKALRDAGCGAGRPGGMGGSGRGAGDSGGDGDDVASRRRARKLGDLQQKLIETSRELLALDQNEIENTLKGQRLKKKHDLLLQEASKSLQRATDEIKPGTFSQMYADVRAFSRNTEGLTSKLAQATKNASLFSASMIQSHELIAHGSHAYRDFMGTMGAAAGKLNKSFLRQNRLINDITGEIRNNIDPAAIAQLRIKTGRIQAMMIEQLSSLGLKDVSQLSPQELARRTATGQQSGPGSAQEMHRAILTVARQLQAEGVINVGDLSDATKVNYTELAQKVQGAGASLREFNATVDAEGKRASSIWSRYITGGATTLHGAVTNYAKKLTDTATIMANAGKAVAASKGVYQDLMKFNIAGLAIGFADAEKMSVRMGMSFEDTVAYLQENKRMLGLYGSTEFAKLNSDFEKTFNKFGYTMQQGAAAIGPAMEAGLTAGIDVRSGKELNKYLEQTASSFAEVSGFINESLPEYAKLTAALYNESEIKTTLLGLDNKRSALYARSLQQQRDELTTRGLSLQQANEVIKLQERAMREKVSSRIQSGAMLAIQAQQFGMGAEGMRAMRIKAQGVAATEEDKKWLTGKFLPEFAKRRAQYGSELAGTGLGDLQALRDNFMDLTEVTGATGEQIKALEEAVKTEKAGAKPTAADKEKIKREAAGSQSVAKMGDAVNTVTSIINNNFAVALYSATAALAGLAGAAVAGALATSAAGAAGVGILGTLLGTLGATLTRVATFAKFALKMGGVALLGTGVDYAGDYVKEKGHEKTGAALNVLGKTAAFAGTGATIGGGIGAMFGGIGAGPGALAGGILGGIVGAGYGIYKDVLGLGDEDEEHPEQAEPAEATSETKPVEDSPLKRQQDEVLKAQQEAVGLTETARTTTDTTVNSLTSLASSAQSVDSAFKQLAQRVLMVAGGQTQPNVLAGRAPLNKQDVAFAAAGGGMWQPPGTKTAFDRKEGGSVSGTIKMGKPEGPIQFNGKTVNPGDPDYEAASRALMAQKRKAEMMRTPAGRKAYLEEIKKNPPAQPATDLPTDAGATVLQGAGPGGILGGILGPVGAAARTIATGAKGIYDNYFKDKGQPQGANTGVPASVGPPANMSVSGTIKMGKPEGPIQFNGRTVNPGDPDYEAASRALIAQKRKAEMMRTPAGRKAYLEEIKKNPPAQPTASGGAVVVNTAGFAPPGVAPDVAPGTAPGSPAVNTTVPGSLTDGSAPVSDLTAQQKLEIIASNMIEAVSLLKQISANTDAGTKEIRSARPAASTIPNQSSYLTGRVQ